MASLSLLCFFPDLVQGCGVEYAGVGTSVLWLQVEVAVLQLRSWAAAVANFSQDLFTPDPAPN